MFRCRICSALSLLPEIKDSSKKSIFKTLNTRKVQAKGVIIYFVVGKNCALRRPEVTPPLGMDMRPVR